MIDSNNNMDNLEKLKSQNEEFSNAIDNLSADFNMTLRKIAHEFGNVLTLISSSLQIIQSSHPEVHSFKYWDTTIDDINYLSHLVTELSLFNNSECLNLAPVNIKSIINTVVHSFSTTDSVSDRNINISLHTPEIVPDILGDYTKLKQVLINLIKNAIEASDENSTISITISPQISNLVITIADEGCGMTPEQLENIFLPMVTYKKCGTGLGLPISKKIINAHHGHIHASSVSGHGSTFEITLPI